LKENIYQIIKVNGDGLKYGRFNQGERYAVHEDILPQKQISLNFDTLRLPYSNRICQKLYSCPK